MFSCGSPVRSCWAELKYDRILAVVGRGFELWLLKVQENWIPSIFSLTGWQVCREQQSGTAVSSQVQIGEIIKLNGRVELLESNITSSSSHDTQSATNGQLLEAIDQENTYSSWEKQLKAVVALASYLTLTEFTNRILICTLDTAQVRQVGTWSPGKAGRNLEPR